MGRRGRVIVIVRYCDVVWLYEKRDICSSMMRVCARGFFLFSGRIAGISTETVREKSEKGIHIYYIYRLAYTYRIRTGCVIRVPETPKVLRILAWDNMCMQTEEEIIVYIERGLFFFFISLTHTYNVPGYNNNTRPTTTLYYISKIHEGFSTQYNNI